MLQRYFEQKQQTFLTFGVSLKRNWKLSHFQSQVIY
jgi:hypothetical protein